MPLDSILRNAVLGYLDPPTYNMAASAIVIMTADGMPSPVCGPANGHLNGNHAETIVLGNMAAWLLPKLKGLAMTVQFYCTHSPCGNCAQALQGLPAWANAQMGPGGRPATAITWEYYWSQHWAPPGLAPGTPAYALHINQQNANLATVGGAWAVTQV
ncbi:MAG: hypothetical protein IT167_10400 [Bryobacterales bacterium]|nr:hypothetical protein [Bryobacterales bacterium]